MVEVRLYSWQTVDVSVPGMGMVLTGKDVPRAPIRLPSPVAPGKEASGLTPACIPEALHDQGKACQIIPAQLSSAAQALQAGEGCK